MGFPPLRLRRSLALWRVLVRAGGRAHHRRPQGIGRRRPATLRRVRLRAHHREPVRESPLHAVPQPARRRQGPGDGSPDLPAARQETESLPERLRVARDDGWPPGAPGQCLQPDRHRRARQHHRIDAAASGPGADSVASQRRLRLSLHPAERIDHHLFARRDLASARVVLRRRHRPLAHRAGEERPRRGHGGPGLRRTLLRQRCHPHRRLDRVSGLVQGQAGARAVSRVPAGGAVRHQPRQARRVRVRHEVPPDQRDAGRRAVSGDA